MAKSGENTLGKYHTDLMSNTTNSEGHCQHEGTSNGIQGGTYWPGTEQKEDLAKALWRDQVVSIYEPLLGTHRRPQRALCKASGPEILHSNCEDLSHLNLGIQSKCDPILCGLTGWGIQDI